MLDVDYTGHALDAIDSLVELGQQTVAFESSVVVVAFAQLLAVAVDYPEIVVKMEDVGYYYPHYYILMDDG